ncbi:hypothetical protein P3T73_04595 [Kiritimatiellota bacterium B12222]|nr:hypothetical protein P3T73_04595 [Kiritimatiellota bacterium B12222]
MHKGFIKISFWVLAFFCLLIFLAYWSLFILPRNKIEALDAELQAQGVAIRIAELAPEPVPEDENAAPLYLEAYRLLQSIKFEGEDIFYYIQGYDVEGAREEKLEGLLTLLDDPIYAEAMSLIDEASTRPRCQFEINYQVSASDLLLPHVTPLIGMARVIHTQVEVELDRNEFSGLSDALSRLHGIALLLEDEPFLLSQLVRVANQSLYVESLKPALAKSEASAELLEELQWQLSQFSDELSTDWIQGERIYMLDFARSGNYLEMQRMSLSDVWDEFGSLSDVMNYIGVLLFPVWDELYLYESILELQPLYEMPYAQIDWMLLDQRFNEIPDFYMMSQDSLDFRRALDSLTNAKAHLKLSKVAVALYQLRLQTGAFPDELSEHTQLDLIDPFVARPFQYEKTEEGFRLYSLGNNQTDDGGVTERKSQKDDLLWSYPYVKQ